MNSKIIQKLPANVTEADNNKWACLSVKNGTEAAVLKNVNNISTNIVELCCFLLCIVRLRNRKFHGNDSSRLSTKICRP